jgi:transcriptional/translational regulatory protein YebC/TACO1
LSKNGGNLGANGCVSYIFHKKGVLVFESSVISEDDAMAIAIEAGAEDVISEDDSVVVYTSPDDFENVLKAFDDKGIAHVSAEVTMVPDTYQEVSADRVDKILALVEKLEDFDDVQAVYTNLKIPDDYQA